MLQIWTPVRQPDTSSIARGIESAGAGIGGGLRDMAARMERQKQEDKDRAEQAKEIRGMAKILAKRMGKTPGEIETADAAVLGGELKGFLREEILKSEEAQRAASEEQLKNQILQREDMSAQRGYPAEILKAYAQRAGARQAPGDLMAGRGPLDDAGFDASVSASGPEAMNPMALAMLEAAARNRTALPPALMNQILEQSGADSPFFDRSQIGRGLPVMGPGNVPIPGTYQVGTGPKTSQIVTDPTTPQRPAGERASDEGMIEIPDPDDPVFGPKIRMPLSTAREKYPHLLKRLDQDAGPAKPGGQPGATGPPTIRTQAEYDQLKSGDTYIDAASGKTKRKK